MPFTLNSTFIKRVITGIFIGLIFWGVYFYLPPLYFSLFLLAILGLIIVFEWTRFFTVAKPMFWILMPFYPIAPFALLIALNHQPLYRELLLILFVLVFSFDTGGYIIGHLCGKHTIAPTISPNKTWEGIIGGYLFACAGLALIIFERDYTKPWWLMALLAAIVCTLSFIGDLFESWLKRRARIKDSGTMLPGHGGFLDRFDGIMFAVFFFYLFKDLLIDFLIN